MIGHAPHRQTFRELIKIKHDNLNFSSKLCDQLSKYCRIETEIYHRQIMPPTFRTSRIKVELVPSSTDVTALVGKRS